MCRRVFMFVFSGMCIASFSNAQDTGVIARAVEAVSVQQNATPDKPAGFEAWQRQLDEAKTERRRARNFILLGIGVGVAGTILATTAAERDIADCVFGNDCGRGAGWALGWTSMLAGSGLAGYGGWKYVSAKDRIDDLDRDGRMKGFLSWAPSERGGVQVGIRVAF